MRMPVISRTYFEAKYDISTRRIGQLITFTPHTYREPTATSAPSSWQAEYKRGRSAGLCEKSASISITYG